MHDMRPEVKRWFKIVFCTLMVVFCVSIGFSDWVYPDNSGDQTTSSEQPDIVAEPCCFIDDNPNKKYVKIEDALKIAKKNPRNDIIYVLPGSNPIIESNCKVEKGDTLCLPYSITKDDKGDPVYNWKKIDNRVAGFADESKAKVDENRKNIVTIKSGITLTVEGTLQIGGEMGSYSAGVAGQTNGNYCEIQMEPKSKISSTGELYCFGYIKETRYIDVETEYSQEAIVDVSGGTVHIPLVIHDFKGGTITVSRFKAGQQSPFEVVDIVNIQSLFRFHNPAIMKAYADLYAGDKHNTTNFNIFSPSNSLLNFASGAYMESKYINKDYWVTESNGKLYSYTTSYNSDAIDNGTEAVAKQFRVHNKISLYGSVSFGTMSMTITLKEIGSLDLFNYTISTAEIYFPISFRQQIHIYGNFSSDYQIQIMGGCNVYVEEGASFTNSANFLGYGDDVKYINSVTVDGVDHHISCHYSKYFIGKSAKLYLKGKYTQSANGFACKVISQSNNAQLDILNASTTTLQTTENGYKEISDKVEQGKFVISPKTTVIERITGNAISNVATVSTGLDVIDDVTLSPGVSYNGKLLKEDHFLYYSTVEDDFYSLEVNTVKEFTPSSSEKKFSTTFTYSIKSKDDRITSKLNFSKDDFTLSTSRNYTATITNWTTTSCTVEVTVKENESDNVELIISGYFPYSNISTLSTTIAKIKQNCLLYDSMLLMADGTYKKAGEVVPGDMVMSFNHETGKIEPTAVIVNDDVNNEATNYNVINLHFSDGTKTSIVSEHGFFDLDLNKYVYIREDNYSQYIGHNFYGINGNGDLSSKKVKLLSIDVEEKLTKVCSPVTANNLNIISDNMLSMAGGIEGLFNFFDYNPVTLKYDEAKKEADIEKYGLLTYEDYKDLLPYEVYEVLPCQYMSVSIGKGLITWDKIKEYINHWGDQLLQ